MDNIIPIVMIRNEEVWIERVLIPLSNCFPLIIVGDTNSTDSTVEQILKVPNIHLEQYPDAHPDKVGVIRQALQDVAAGYGAEWVFQVDGDELYPTSVLRWILDNPMPEGKLAGFTCGIEVTELENGECWYLNNKANRLALFPVTAKWKGTYPFEGIDIYDHVVAHPELQFHWGAPPGQDYHYFHLHQMNRSHKDGDVHMRVFKQYRFSMIEHPEIVPKSLWLKNQSEYEDY